MKKYLKNNVHIEPSGYFDALPDRIILKKKKKAREIFLYRISAAAAVLVLGIFFSFFFMPDNMDYNLQASLDSEVELYISSGYWNAEDVLGFSNDPNGILDQIIEEEWSVFNSEEIIDEEFWY